MSYAAIADAEAVSTNSTSVTTTGVDSTGADLITVVGSVYSALDPAITDSKGNSYTGHNVYRQVFSTTQIFHCSNPTVGASHTVTNTGGYPSVGVSFWSGSHATPFDQQNGGTAASSPVSAGSVTPSEDNELLITGYSDGTVAGSCNSIPTGFTSLGTLDATANANGVGHAYEIQTTATARTPSWGFTSASELSAAVATFKAAAAAASTKRLLLMGVG